MKSSAPQLLKLAFHWVPPFVLGRVRAQTLQLLGVRPGRGTAFWGTPTIVGWRPHEELLIIGNHCGFNVDCLFELGGKITIGDNVAVGHRVAFLTEHFEKRDLTSTTSSGRDICIRDGVWLGARCTVLGGVTIGAGSVVAAGAVVRESLPENTMFTGSRNISLARWR